MIRPTMARATEQFGLWMIGAAGGIGGAVALGISGLAKGLVPTTGLVTAGPEFASARLIHPSQIVVGGHEIRRQTLAESVRALHADSNVVDAALIEACARPLAAMQKNVKPGILLGSVAKVRDLADRGCVRSARNCAEAIAAIRKDLVEFRDRHRLAHVIVVNVASTEPPLETLPAQNTYAELERSLKKTSATVLPASSLYALGAFAADCSYINFTPSAGHRVPAIEEFAAARDVLFMGRDGKTGETLLKSVLAPMFATRNLKLHSWVGHNVLGNRDGEILSDPDVKVSKIKSKDQLVSQIVGYKPQTRTSIEFLPSLCDWKVAWDFIHFEGFLSTKMNLQFIWTGCDSLLAAPLVIDLVRLTAHEHRSGRRGAMEHLACFFKDPDGVVDHHYFRQWQRLVEHFRSPSPARPS